ncbi:MAG: Stp1/IreP family PP2C-type Ser/Thr phosphatase [Capsulimonadales bacterium]|nr:Stp1/IreP family PP2C-type Ser/Thr phosphatase [Capsulimonadales bacterium]
MSETTDEFDAAVLVSGWAAIAERKPQRHVHVDWAARTDIGRLREHNEDKFDFFLPTDPTQLAMRGRLWAVADGMGGHAAGQIASEAALKTVVRAFFAAAAAEDTETALRAALAEANALIHHAARQFERKAGGMGTTIVVAIVKEDVLTIAHVGDSRLYLMREGDGLRTLTVDHSWVEEQVRRGAMSREEAERSPYRNYILRSVGVDKVVEPDVTQITVRPGDTFLLCSDGLCGYISDELIASTLSGKNASQAVLDLIDVANDAGGKDNVTALVLRVLDVVDFADR